MCELITAAIIAKDEEDVIARCVRSVKSAVDEVLVYDTGSMDDTQKIAESEGAVVRSDGPWEDFHFAEARNRVAELASHPWIFVIDADEVLLLHHGHKRLRRALRRFEAEGKTSLAILWQQKSERTYIKTASVRAYHRDFWRWRFRVHNELRDVGTESKQATVENRDLKIIMEQRPKPDAEQEKERREIRFKQTKALLEKCIKEDPTHIEAHRYLADAYFWENRYADSIRAARRYLREAEGKRVDLDLSEGHCYIARAYDRLGDVAEALRAYKEASRIAPNRREPLWDAAMMLRRSGIVEGAVSLLRELLKIPKDKKPLHAYTWDWVWGKAPEEALRQLQERRVVIPH